MSAATFFALASKLDKETLALVGNLAQHIAQHATPIQECKRLMRILDPQLDPKFRMQVNKPAAPAKPKGTKIRRG